MFLFIGVPGTQVILTVEVIEEIYFTVDDLICGRINFYTLSIDRHGISIPSSVSRFIFCRRLFKLFQVFVVHKVIGESLVCIGKIFGAFGSFTFEVIDNNKLKVNGTGAHLGLYKAANPPEAAVTTPQASITYQIVSITATRMVLKIDYGWGAWKFTYVAI